MMFVLQKASNVCATMATEQLADLENSSVGILVSRDPLNKVQVLQTLDIWHYRHSIFVSVCSITGLGQAKYPNMH